MIKGKRPNTVDEYGDIGFIQAKVGNEYKNIDHIYDSDGNIIFQQGYLNDYEGAADISIPAIGKPLIDYTIWGNTEQFFTNTAKIVAIESDTNYAKINRTAFPSAVVGQTLVATMNNVNYNVTVKKIDNTYIYLTNPEVVPGTIPLFNSIDYYEAAGDVTFPIDCTPTSGKLKTVWDLEITDDSGHMNISGNWNVSGSGSYHWLFWSPVDGFGTWQYNPQMTQFYPAPGEYTDLNTRYTVEAVYMENYRSLKINGTLYETTDGVEVGARTIWLFSNGPDKSEKAYVKLHSLQIYDDTTLIGDFVPVSRKDGLLTGLWNKVNDKVYTNSEVADYYGSGFLPIFQQNDVVLLSSAIPSPDTDTPVYGVGDRTENLLPILPEMLVADNWELAPAIDRIYFEYFKLPDAIKYEWIKYGNISGKMFMKTGGSYLAKLVFAITPNISAGSVTNDMRLLQNTGNLLDYTHDISEYTDIYLCIGNGAGITEETKQTMIDAIFNNYDINIVSGTTVPLSHEPYGYKIPITCAGQTSNIYLSEPLHRIGDYADELNYASGTITRRIKKLVLTEEESTSEYSTHVYFVYKVDDVSYGGLGICTHYSPNTKNSLYDLLTINYSFTVQIASGVSKHIRFHDNNINTASDFKTYLAQQYANGTPVTVWYVLATPVTEQITLPEIPTLPKPNNTTFTVDTMVKPSEVDLTYRGAYKPKYNYFMAANGDTIEAQDGQSLMFNNIVYGWHVNPNESDSYNAVTYLKDAVGLTPAHMGSTTFDYGSWKDAFFMPKPCMVKYDGTVDYYIDPDDYTRKADGSPSDVGNPNYEGNAMMEWPLIWWKYEAGTEDGEGYFYVANNQVDSTYHCWCNYDSKDNIIPHFYTAIYNSTSFSNYNASTTYAVGDTAVYDGKLWKCTTAITTAEAFDSTHWEVWSETAPAINKYHSMSGLNVTPKNGNDVNNAVNKATANNTTSDVEWYCAVYSDRLLINGLLVLMGKSLNSQATFGRGLDSGSTSARRAYVTGSLNDKGLFWGDTSAGTSGVKVFGMETWWGVVFSKVWGLLLDSGSIKLKLTYGTADGSTTVGYNITGEGYISNGTYISSTAGMITKMKYDQYGYFPCAHTGGSKSTYYGDTLYPQSTGIRQYIAGGDTGVGENAGAFCNYLYYGPGAVGEFINTTLTLKPVKK